MASAAHADERTPGVWTMVDSTGRDYGTVRIVREGSAIVYVSELRGEKLGGRNSPPTSGREGSRRVRSITRRTRP